MINFMAQQAKTITELKRDNDERKAKEVTQQKDDDNTPILAGSRLMLTQGPMGGQTNGLAPQPTGYRGF